MEEKELKQLCLKLMETADAAYLGTVGKDSFPQTRMMSNLRNMNQCKAAEEVFKQSGDNFLIYKVTSKSSPKMAEISANSRVSVYYCNAAEFHTLLLVGNIEEADDMDLKKQLWQDEWSMHWPGGPEDPELVLLKLLPGYAKGWYKEGPFEFKLK